MILITTAGKVGSEAARLLTQKDETVRVLVRNPENATALRQLGVDVAEGDLEDSASIDAAMHGVTSVVLVSPAVPAQELNVIDSAARAGVGHVVKVTSKASADSPIAWQRGQAEIEAGLIAPGLHSPCCATTSKCRTSSCWHPRSQGQAVSAPPPAAGRSDSSIHAM